MPDAEPRKWLPLYAVCEELGIARETGRQLIVTGKLKGRRPTGNPRGWWQVDPDDFDRHKAEIAAQSAQPA